MGATTWIEVFVRKFYNKDNGLLLCGLMNEYKGIERQGIYQQEKLRNLLK